MVKHFISLLCEHDLGLITVRGFHDKLNNSFFRKPISWQEFSCKYSRCFPDVHLPMFSELTNLKEKIGVNLICVSDINPFVFAHISLLFPGVFGLFNDGEQERMILSYENHSLKKHGTPFVLACSRFGFSPYEAAYVDDMPSAIEGAIRHGFDPDACFLYRLRNKRNHWQFQKFLSKHFPPK